MNKPNHRLAVCKQCDLSINKIVAQMQYDRSVSTTFNIYQPLQIYLILYLLNKPLIAKFSFNFWLGTC